MFLELRDAPMFLSHCYGVSDLVGDFASLLFGVGLCYQEAACLSVGAVDLGRRILRIFAVERESSGDGVEVATDYGKSVASFRDMPLPQRDDDPLIIILKRRIGGRRSDDWLFTAPRGGRIKIAEQPKIKSNDFSAMHDSQEPRPATHTIGSPILK